MRVFLDARRAQWMPHTGIGRYVSSLVTSASSRSGLTLTPFVSAGQATPPGWRSVAPGLRSSERVIWEQISLPMVVRREKPDIVHLPWYEGSPFMSETLSVTVQDLDTVRDPGGYPPAIRWYYNPLLHKLLNRAAVVVVPSASTADDLIAWQPAVSGRVHVVPYGSSASLMAIGASRHERTESRVDTVLYCGGYAPRKRTDVLIRAFEKVHQKRPSSILVMTGRPDGETSRLLLRSSARLAVKLPGYLTEEELATLYQEAAVSVYASAREGFGFPALDALSAAIPLVASDIPCTRELVGSCALYAPVGDADGLADGILAALESNPSIREMVHRGRERAEGLTWDECLAGHCGAWASAGL
jgi:glycosyltransferase involved in cell wall biosynthesis